MTEPAIFSLLLVEDNPADARLVQELLAESTVKYPVLHVTTLAAGLEALAQHTFDVALLDLSLPDSRGLETLQTMRDASPDLAIVILTGLDDDAMALEAVQSGAQDYLSKDRADRYTLNRAVRYAIQRSNAERVEAERRSLEKAVESMDRVLGVVGHELRTPLGAFRVLLETLMEGQVPTDLEQYLSMLMGQVTHMSQTVNNVLEAARLDSGVAQWHWTGFSIAEAVEPAVDLVRPLLEAGVELSLEMPGRGKTMRGDCEALRRLLINLLSNAAKHTRNGRVTVRAELVDREDGQWTCIRVSDTGRGIPQKTLERLGMAFALNTGVVGACSTGGTGLGLSVCAAIAAAHRGYIEVSSDGLNGSCFTAWLRADLEVPETGGDRSAGSPMRIAAEPFTRRALAS